MLSRITLPAIAALLAVLSVLALLSGFFPRIAAYTAVPLIGGLLGEVPSIKRALDRLERRLGSFFTRAGIESISR